MADIIETEQTFETDLLVIAAHPDDAEFDISGTVAKMTGQGQKVVYVIATSGDKGSTDPEMTPEKLARIREQEQQDAADVLGVSQVSFLRYPDQGLEDTSEFRKHIVAVIRKYRPEIVATSDPYRRYVWHRDHRIMGQVTLDALFPFARDRLAYPDLLEQGLMPHKVKEIWFWGSQDLNHWSDIKETFSLKVKALSCHVSQIKEMNIPDLTSWLKAFSQRYNQGSPYEIAEAFHLEILPA